MGASGGGEEVDGRTARLAGRPAALDLFRDDLGSPLEARAAETQVGVGNGLQARDPAPGRVRVEQVNARQMPYPDGEFPAVVSNSIIHHIPDPSVAFEEMNRVCAPRGLLFVPDLLRPYDEATLRHLVDTHAAGANDHPRKMFADSLRAALTLVEVQDFVGALGYPPETVTATSDRHWTWATIKG